MAVTTVKPQNAIQPNEPCDMVHRLLDAVDAGTTFYPLAFAGLDVDTGYEKKFEGSDPTIWFDGVWDIDMPERFDVAVAAGVRSLRVSKPHKLKVKVEAGGVAVTDVLKPVYAIAANDYSVSLTPPALTGYVDPIGYIEEVISATMVSIKPLYKTQPRLGGGSRSILSLPIALAGVADGDVLTTFTPGFAGKIVKMDFAVTTKVTTASKATTLNAEIGTTNVTGGVIALTSANCTPLGAVVAGTAITAANSFTASDTVSIEASSTTAFSEGAGVLFVVVEAAANDL